jgi:hypothetical protein
VPAETPSPPAFLRERIGKETAAGIPACLFSLKPLLAIGFWLNLSQDAELEAKS